MNIPSLLLNSNTHFLFFGGKGGVGKTTLAATSAIWAAERERKTLIISSDPAHSLSDSFSQKLEFGKLDRIKNVPNLFALEIQTKEELKDNININNEYSELNNFINIGDTPFPGMDEVIAFGKLMEFIKESDFDLIIFDTAPTGHTLRFLGLPDILSSWMTNLLKMRIKFGKLFKGIKSLFSNNKSESESADFLENIELLKKTVQDIKKELIDKEKTSFIIVLIPEIMAILESERLLGTLLQYEINCDNIIINHIMPENLTCEFCLTRRKMQIENISKIKSLYFKEFNIKEINLHSHELREIENLRKFGNNIFE